MRIQALNLIKYTLLSVALLCAVPSGAASGDNAYPSKPITMVVPYPPGGTADVLARLLAEQMSLRLGQTVVISNKGGAGTTIGTHYVAKSAPDGYTLLWTATPFGINPSLFKSLPYDTVNDFTVVSDIAETTLLLAVSEKSSIKSLSDLIVQLKKTENNSYGSAGLGSSPHLVSELLLHEVGGNAEHIAYQGSAPAVTDLVANRTTFMFDTPLLMMPLVKDNKLRALAQTSKDRTDSLPDIPTLAESGYPDLQVTSWFLVAAPSNTPAVTLEKLNNTINDALADPSLIGAYEKHGMTITGSSIEEGQSKLKREVELWSQAVKLSGAQIK